MNTKQIIGSILSIGGLIGIIIYGYQYLDDSESFELLGADVAVSTGDYVPILISLVILVVGILSIDLINLPQKGFVRYLSRLFFEF